MQKISKLQVGIYIVVIFITLIVIFIVLGIIPGLRDQTFQGAITVWGTFPEHSLERVLAAWRDENKNITVRYVQKNPATYSTDFLEAIATGAIPDIILIPDSLLHTMQNKLTPVPGLFMTEREFMETFTSAASALFLQKGTIYGMPLGVDPMVLYWNRDFFASEAIALPPATWDQLLTTSQKLTKRTASGNLTRAGMAMGLSSNIPQAVDIVSLLILQGGVTVIDPQTHAVTIASSVLQNQIRTSPAETALRFYADFARREKISYSWNHTFPDPEQAFKREDLAMFLSRGSALHALSQSAPHIPIGVSPVPQYSGVAVKTGYARTWAFAVPSQSRQQSTAWQVITFMTDPERSRMLAEDLWIAPARRDVLSEGHEFPPFSVFYEEALRAKSWYDPDPSRSSIILKNMIESVSAGRNIKDAVGEAQIRLEGLLK